MGVSRASARDVPASTLAESPRGNRRFGAVIEHHREIRITRRELEQRRQVFRQHQRIEHQAVIDHGFEGRREPGVEHPVGIRDVLDHGPQADELRIRGELGDGVRGVGALEIHPAHDAGDERVLAARARA